MPLEIQLMVRLISAVLACGLMALIYFQSSQPLSISLDRFPFEDKLVHAAAYGALATLFLFSQKLSPRGFSTKQQLIAITLATLYGLSDELHQSFIPERSADAGDLVADGIGAILAVIMISQFIKKRAPVN